MPLKERERDYSVALFILSRKKIRRKRWVLSREWNIPGDIITQCPVPMCLLLLLHVYITLRHDERLQFLRINIADDNITEQS